jgi:PAS domain S-box-containing protein
MSASKKTKKELVAEVEFLHSSMAVYQAASDGYYLLDKSGRFTDVDEGYCNLLGYDRAELLALGIGEIQISLSAASAGDRFEACHKSKNGSRVYLLLSSNASTNGDIFYSVLDITGWKQTEDELRDSKAELESFFLAAPVGIGVISGEKLPKSRERILLSVNERFCEITGYNRAEIVGQKVRILYPSKADYLRGAKYKHTPGSKRKITTIETRWKCKDGKVIDVQLSSTPLDPHDLSVGITFAVLDITERKRATEANLRYQTELRSLASRLTLAEENERRKIALYLHDNINQALAFSILKLRSLGVSKGSDAIAQFDEICQELQQAIMGMRKLTSDLSSTTLYKIGLEAAICELLEDFFGRDEQIEHEFIDDKSGFQLNKDVCVVLFRSVRELLVNIVKHAKATKVCVSISKEAESTRILIVDNGVGFDIKSVNCSSGRRYGLGLFSIEERLSFMGGSFLIESEPGKGTRIELRAPLAVDENSYLEK